MVEIKIVYIEGQEIRAIRGELKEDRPDFLILRRENSEVRINKRYIIKTEEVGL